jgi:hypothetical protein
VANCVTTYMDMDRKKLIVFLLLIPLLVAGILSFIFHDDQNTETNNNVAGSTEENLSDKKLPTSDTSSGGLISPTGEYAIIIKPGSKFPHVVELKSNKEYLLKPGEHYTSVTNPKWSADGQRLAFTYTIPEPGYGDNIIAVVGLNEVLTGQYPNARRVLTAGKEVDYEWLNNDSLLHYQLLNYDPALGYYKHAAVGIYHAHTDKFNFVVPPYLERVYSAAFSPDKQKFLYQRWNEQQQRKEYVIISIREGQEIKTFSTEEYSEQ